ncbi:Protein RecA [Pseudomonas amygdali pv. lachrymans]|uniref:Protein RecA n=1 Tax=Pseudomonas amygdali pv. lachrymans TaxID=53707 RepID=A0ABR5KRY0_PSEAV|nr:Protein RecA [Pseudomonas amygdali pv. lachrymans]
MSTDQKKAALATALTQIEKQFGKGAVMRMGDQERMAIPAISTGSLNLDIALGIGGLPKGRIVEIYGPESSGKTTLTLSVIAEAQKNGATCAFVDAEHALDPEYAAKLGVNVDDLLVAQPDTGEQALEITDMLVRSGSVDVLIVDSVAALVPKAEIEGEMGDMHVGLQARLMSQALRKITGNIKNANCLVIFINQIRMKIGVMFGSPETTTGGNALKFYSSVRLDIRRTGAVKDGDNIVGSETRVKVVKNKVAPPFRQAEFQILYGEGIGKFGELVDLGVADGLIDKSGAWYAYGGNKIGQGKANTIKYLAENPAVAQELEALIRNKHLANRVIEPPRVANIAAVPTKPVAAAPALKPAAQTPAPAPKPVSKPIAEAQPTPQKNAMIITPPPQAESRVIEVSSEAQDSGIDGGNADGSLVELAVDLGVIVNENGFFRYGTINLGQTLKEAEAKIESDPNLRAVLRQDLE